MATVRHWYQHWFMSLALSMMRARTLTTAVIVVNRVVRHLPPESKVYKDTIVQTFKPLLNPCSLITENDAKIKTYQGSLRH